MANGVPNTAARHQPRLKPKTHIEKQAMAVMEKYRLKPEWSVRQKLALTARMLAAKEHA